MKNIVNTLCTSLIFSALAISSPGHAANSSKTVNPSAKESIAQLLKAQTSAWNSGDLDAFLSGYLHSPNTSYTSGGTEVWGYDALRERYKKRYGDKRETMGQLTFSNLKIFETAKNSALCIGHWHLERKDQTKGKNLPTLDGIFSLVYVRIGRDWKILHDHTSVKEAH
jgi:ketosteroid isomerase-like protein